MANIKSAKKRIRVIDKKTARNRRIKNHLKAVLKAFADTENTMPDWVIDKIDEKVTEIGTLDIGNYVPEEIRKAAENANAGLQ